MIIVNGHTISPGSNLYGENLSRADLSRADLSGADLFGADLTGANMREACLFWANMSGANMSGANMRGANLSGANMRGANIKNCIGNGKEIKTMYFSCWIVNFTGSVMSIGCEQHSIEDWRNFTDEQISKMDEKALDFWRLWEDAIFQIIEKSEKRGLK